MEQIIVITEQLILLSAFLGGFSATFLAAILGIAPSNKIANWMVFCSALAACCFIICAGSSIALANALQLSTDLESLKFGRLTSSLSMALGMFSLISSIGLSGWLRNQKTGFATSSIAAVTTVIVAVFL